MKSTMFSTLKVFFNPLLTTGFVLSFILSTSLYSQTDPKLTEVWSPIPEVVDPGNSSKAPSDAVILFDGGSQSEWTKEDGSPAAWIIKNKILTVKQGAGSIITKQKFSDCQLHIEWKTPEKVQGEGQERGNSGVFLQSRYEVQILDSYNNPTYSNGQAGSIYKQSIPLVNACRKPGEWQTYDIVYMAPRFNVDSTLKTPAYVTVFQNGILVQYHVAIKGSTVYIGQPAYTKHAFKESLMLQNHGNPVSFRNIWIREINVN